MEIIIKGLLVVVGALVLVGFFGWVFWLAVIDDLGCLKDMDENNDLSMDEEADR
jgi:hypothetical protein